MDKKNNTSCVNIDSYIKRSALETEGLCWPTNGNIMNCSNTSKLRQMAVSESNYFALKRLGKAGDSFNDVITEMLKKIGLPETESTFPVGQSPARTT